LEADQGSLYLTQLILGFVNLPKLNQTGKQAAFGDQIKESPIASFTQRSFHLIQQPQYLLTRSPCFLKFLFVNHLRRLLVPSFQ
jgi:hypothetical protein